MNKIQSVIVATFVVIPFTTAVFAADAGKPVVPAPPVVASQPAAADAGKPVVAAQTPAADAAAKNRAARLRERNMKARALSGSAKKAVAAPAPAADAAAAMKAKKLQERNMKARAHSKTMNSAVPKETAPVVPPAAK